MDHFGIDVHKRESQICLLAECSELVERRILREPERFAACTRRPTPGADRDRGLDRQ